jgi:hypothetical protein
MLRTIFLICSTVYFASAAGMGIAQPSPQAFFKIVNATGPGQSTNGGASVRLPVLSFVVDNNLGLRPMIGIPGSASIGSALDLGFEVVRAAAPPGHDYILAMTNEGSWPRLLQVRGGTITIRSTDSFDHQHPQSSTCEWPADAPWPKRRRPSQCLVEPFLTDGATNIDRIALSPTGSAAAFFSESQQRIYAFTNLSESPTLLGKFEVGGLGPISAMAISDDGQNVALGVSEGDTGALVLVSLNLPPRLIASMRHPSAIAFLRRSDDAIIADDVENRIYMLSGRAVFTVATAENGISGPIGIAVSNDNQRIFVGNSQSGSVTTIGPNGVVREPRYCNCTLTGLHPTNTDSVFRLTDSSGGPVLLLDANGAAPRMIFAPLSPQF